MTDTSNPRSASRWTRAALLAIVVVGAAAAGLLLEQHGLRKANGQTEVASLGHPPGTFVATEAQWAALGVAPVTRQVFRSAHDTEGKIAIDEDRSTPVFSPYAGRVTKLFAKPGEQVAAG